MEIVLVTFAFAIIFPAVFGAVFAALSNGIPFPVLAVLAVFIVIVLSGS